MSRLADDELRNLAHDLAAAVRVYVPDWSSSNDSDPGITILELFAFLGDQLEFRGSRSTGDTGDELTRPRYFAGQLLTADVFQAEQDYFRHRLRRLNLSIFGAGVVSGLEVNLVDGSAPNAPVVAVEPGVAIAPNGEELVLCEKRVCALSASASEGYVTLRFLERVVSSEGEDEIAGDEPARIVESVNVEFHANSPADGVPIARLARVQSSWVTDPDFVPRRARVAHDDS